MKFLFRKLWSIEDKRLEVNIAGLKFKNPIGLAAGFDKDGKYYKAMQHLGFGFIEIGTVTPKGQIGNPQPRLFRIKEDEALLNRMGFNNEGVEAMVHRLKSRDKDFIIGGNLGKNKVTPNENAVDDYVYSFNALFDDVDYFVVNVSSPNTPGLRELQDKKPLTEILNRLQVLNNEKANSKPIFLKIAPDLEKGQIDDIIDIINDTKLAGIIASNTTISRNHLKIDPMKLGEMGNGGISGKPVTKKSNDVIRYIHEKSNGQIPIIGVGGVHSPQDVLDKLEAGASLVQVYTGLIYEGPTLIKKSLKAILSQKN